MVLSNCNPWAQWRKYARKCVLAFQPVIGLGPDPEVSPTLDLAQPLFCQQQVSKCSVLPEIVVIIPQKRAPPGHRELSICHTFLC